MFVESKRFNGTPGLEISHELRKLRIKATFEDGTYEIVCLKLSQACLILLGLRTERRNIETGGLRIFFPDGRVEFKKAGKSLYVYLYKFEQAIKKTLQSIFVATPCFEAWFKKEAEKARPKPKRKKRIH